MQVNSIGGYCAPKSNIFPGPGPLAFGFTGPDAGLIRAWSSRDSFTKHTDKENKNKDTSEDLGKDIDIEEENQDKTSDSSSYIPEDPCEPFDVSSEKQTTPHVHDNMAAYNHLSKSLNDTIMGGGTFNTLF